MTTKPSNNPTANPTTITLKQFQQSAIRHKLSASAILLWQHVYFIGQEKGQHHNLCLRTADLTQALNITRNGLQKIRHALVNAGLLQIRIDQHQHVWYTLCLDNAVGDGSPVPHNEPYENKPGGATPPLRQQTVNPSTQPSTNILRDNTYRKQINAFCTALDGPGINILDTVLLQFMHQRKTKGKTLTQAGLEALLDKLVHLAEGNIHQMINIVKQSLAKGWSGFYPCKQTNLQATYTPNNRTSRIPKYDTKYEDLDFLEW